MKKITLYEIIKQAPDKEFTVWDKDWDIEIYFAFDDSDDLFMQSQMAIAKLLEVYKIEQNGLTVNLGELIENHIPQLRTAELFYKYNIEAIIDDIEAIFAGNVSDEWMQDFAIALTQKTVDTVPAV